MSPSCSYLAETDKLELLESSEVIRHVVLAMGAAAIERRGLAASPTIATLSSFQLLLLSTLISRVLK